MTGPPAEPTWAALFDRGEATAATEADVREALAAIREGDD